MGLSFGGFTGGTALIAERIRVCGVGRLESGSEEAGTETPEKEGGSGLCGCVGFDGTGLC